MATEIITKEDLNEFRELLLNDFKTLLQGKPVQENTRWLKSYQVKNMLTISPRTLQNLRLNGTLSFTKIGGILYYNYDDNYLPHRKIRLIAITLLSGRGRIAVEKKPFYMAF
jgi:hypothetical protein